MNQDVKQPRVAVATIGRFHSFDLAAELNDRGALAAIYTGLPRRVFRDTRVPSDRISSFPWVQAPTEAAQRIGIARGALLRELSWRAHETLDRHVARTLPDCDVLTALSGSGLHAGRAIQTRGGVYVCDRGSSHIRFQDRLLRAEFEALGIAGDTVDPRKIEKECAEYDAADAITVPSSFVLDSFVDAGVPREKLHLIPYGVDIAAFRPCAERAPRFRVLFVGGLSARKGLHYLLEAFARAALGDAELILAGPAQSETEELLARFPAPNVVRLGPLSRTQVAVEMSKASVLVLPSIEEGLALVQAQALACGCPVIATANTGAEDLFDDDREGFIVAPRDVDAIAACLVLLRTDPDRVHAMSRAALARVRSFGGWRDYGAASLRLFASLARGETPAAPSVAKEVCRLAVAGGTR